MFKRSETWKEACKCADMQVKRHARNIYKQEKHPCEDEYRLMWITSLSEVSNE
jgi:hypothetical protein